MDNFGFIYLTDNPNKEIINKLNAIEKKLGNKVWKTFNVPNFVLCKARREYFETDESKQFGLDLRLESEDNRVYLLQYYTFTDTEKRHRFRYVTGERDKQIPEENYLSGKRNQVKVLKEFVNKFYELIKES